MVILKNIKNYQNMKKDMGMETKAKANLRQTIQVFMGFQILKK